MTITLHYRHDWADLEAQIFKSLTFFFQEEKEENHLSKLFPFVRLRNMRKLFFLKVLGVRKRNVKSAHNFGVLIASTTIWKRFWVIKSFLWQKW